MRVVSIFSRKVIQEQTGFLFSTYLSHSNSLGDFRPSFVRFYFSMERYSALALNFVISASSRDEIRFASLILQRMFSDLT